MTSEFHSLLGLFSMSLWITSWSSWIWPKCVQLQTEIWKISLGGSRSPQNLRTKDGYIIYLRFIMHLKKTGNWTHHIKKNWKSCKHFQRHVLIGTPFELRKAWSGFQEKFKLSSTLWLRGSSSLLWLYDNSFFHLTDQTISFIVDKVDAAVQTLCDGVLEQQGMSDIKGCCEEVKEKVNEKSLDCEKGNVYAGIPRAMDNYVACRLATPFLPSPLLDRRTILWSKFLPVTIFIA